MKNKIIISGVILVSLVCSLAVAFTVTRPTVQRPSPVADFTVTAVR